MTTLALATKTGIHVKLPNGERHFIPESESDWAREREVLAFPIRVTTRQRVGRVLMVNAKTVRVVKHLEELNQ